MASDNPFANLGLGMMGQDTAIARQAASPDSSEKGRKILGALAAGAIDAVGLKDFFNSLGGSDQTQTTSAGVPAPSAAYGIAPPAPISAGGINPMRLPNALPGGVGLNVQPANPFVFQINPATKPTADDEHRNQIKNAWS